MTAPTSNEQAIATHFLNIAKTSLEKQRVDRADAAPSLSRR
jgi:hypothetical protein